jgi:hypothetical protein
MLAPLAITTHGWFLFNSMLVTVFVPFALLSLQLTAFELGLTLAAAGVGGLMGSLLSTRIGMRWGAGRVVIACRALMPLAWAIIAGVPASDQGNPHWITLVLVGSGQFLYGLAIGVENANEMGYRQAVTPDALQSRMNTTIAIRQPGDDRRRCARRRPARRRHRLPPDALDRHRRLRPSSRLRGLLRRSDTHDTETHPAEWCIGHCTPRPYPRLSHIR